MKTTTTTTPLLWLPIRTSWTFTCQCKQFWILLNQAVFLRYHLLQIYFPDLRFKPPTVPTQVHCDKINLIFRSNYPVFPQWSKNHVILVSSLFKHYTRKLYWVHLIITFAIIPSIIPSGCGKATGAATHYNSSFCKIFTFTVSIPVELPVLSVEQFVVLTLRTCRASEPIGAATYIPFFAAQVWRDPPAGFARFHE